MLGFTAEQMGGQYGSSIFELIDPMDVPTIEAALTYMSLSGKSWSGDMHIRTAKGDYGAFKVYCREAVISDDETVLNMFFTNAVAQPDLQRDHRMLLDALPCAVGIYNYKKGSLQPVYHNDAFRLMLHLTGSDFQGKRVLDAIYPDDLPLFKSSMESCARHSGMVQLDIRCVNGYGQYVLLHAASRNIHTDGDGATLCVAFTLASDQAAALRTALGEQTAVIERERENAQKLQAAIDAEKRRSVTFSMLFLGAAEGKYDIILHINLDTRMTSRLNFADGAFGMQPRVEDWDDILSRLLGHIHADDKKNIQQKLNSLALRDTPSGTAIELTYRRHLRGNMYHWFSARFRIFMDERDGHIAIGLLSDINDEMEEQSRLHDLAEHDTMTDLFNRSKLESMTQGEYKNLRACGVIFFDLNGLKDVNDNQGHSAGDALLRAMADGIRSITSRRIHAYRYGGDEFIVVVCNGDETELHQLTLLCQTRLEMLEHSSGIHVTAAVGYAWREAPFDVNDLISEADSAMYADKQKNCRGRRQ